MKKWAVSQPYMAMADNAALQGTKPLPPIFSESIDLVVGKDCFSVLVMCIVRYNMRERMEERSDAPLSNPYHPSQCTFQFYFFLQFDGLR